MRYSIEQRLDKLSLLFEDWEPLGGLLFYVGVEGQWGGGGGC